jgi:hypothetical protein
MPDSLYEHDILTWSERQAELLRRVANGDRVNDVDWPHVIEEIADVGISELNAVRSLLRQADTACVHWHLELDAFVDSVLDRYAPSMGQRIDTRSIWDRARQRAIKYFAGNHGAAALPAACPWTLGDLLANDHEALLAAMQSASDSA